MSIKFIISWLFRVRRRFHSLTNAIGIAVIIIFFLNIFPNTQWPSIGSQKPDRVHNPLEELIPPDSFDLFWTMWNTGESTFRGRRLLVLESLLIHHPQATVIMLSPTLNDTTLFLPFRRRGYRIYSLNVSLEQVLGWKWYLTEEAHEFLRQWNTSGPYFYSHVTDYMRAILLYMYGGTYMDMDALILQPLPAREFIGRDRSGAAQSCTWCIKNSSGLYLAPGFMRFRPGRKVFRHILDDTFNRKTYNPSCFNCVGPKAFTEHIIQHRNANDSELRDLEFLEPHRLYPFMWRETLNIFHDVQKDTSLQLADLMKRCYSLHLFGHMSDPLSIARGSLIDFLFDRFDLGGLRPRIPNHDVFNETVNVIHAPLYVYTHRKRGRFLGRDVIYLRLNTSFNNEDIRWNLTLNVTNGTFIHSNSSSFTDINQAQINTILFEMAYEPFRLTSIDTLVIHLTSNSESFPEISFSASVTILVFSKWVTILTKTMGNRERWPIVQRLVTSVEKFFPQTLIRIASDSGVPINKMAFFNSSLLQTQESYMHPIISIDNMPEDSGLSISRNYLIRMTSTPFFFLMDDDFELEEDSHLDLLLEFIYTHKRMDIVAGKIPEDIKSFHDFSGVFLRYNETLELRYDIPDDRKTQALFHRTLDYENDEWNWNNMEPCRQVDFVPNVFMGRTETFRSIGWDENLKLGEHEDFFVRFGQAKRTVYTCRHIRVHHHQVPWWKKVKDPYYSKRARVHGYFKQMLQKHGLKRLITFGLMNINLDNERPTITTKLPKRRKLIEQNFDADYIFNENPY